jgi:hydrogenase expression/formation protein HypC
MCLALPCRIVELLPGAQAMIDVGGVGKEISLALVDDVAVGDYVIVHVGYALSRLDRRKPRRRSRCLPNSAKRPCTRRARLADDCPAR